MVVNVITYTKMSSMINSFVTLKIEITSFINLNDIITTITFLFANKSKLRYFKKSSRYIFSLNTIGNEVQVQLCVCTIDQSVYLTHTSVRHTCVIKLCSVSWLVKARRHACTTHSYTHARLKTAVREWRRNSRVRLSRLWWGREKRRVSKFVDEGFYRRPIRCARSANGDAEVRAD